MSTTFEVIPVETKDITFKQLIDLSEHRINEYLKRVDEGLKISLHVTLHEHSEKYVREIDLNSKFEWNKNEYIWFTVNGIAGGTDVYCEEIKDSDIDPDNPWWIFDDMITNNRTINNFIDKTEKAKLLNRYWRFRRSAGQPAIINLTYGLISASLSELTKGFIWTDDGAWSFAKFPTEATEFYKWYFRSEIEEDHDYSEWAKECVGFLQEEIKS